MPQTRKPAIIEPAEVRRRKTTKTTDDSENTQDDGEEPDSEEEPIDEMAEEIAEFRQQVSFIAGLHESNFHQLFIHIVCVYQPV